MIAQPTSQQTQTLTSQPAHQRERLLLVVAGLFGFTAQGLLVLTGTSQPSHMWVMAAWALCALLGHWALGAALPQRDPYLFPVVMLLAAFGLTTISRLTPLFAARQTLWLLLSVLVLALLARAPVGLGWLSRYRYVWLVGGLLLLALTILLGRNPSSALGPRLWLGIDEIFFQPAELLKVLLVAFMASYLAEYYAPIEGRLPQDRLPLASGLRLAGPLLLMWGLSILILLWQRDLGTATLFFLVFMALLYLAVGQVWLLFGGLALMLGAAFVAYRFIDVVRLRIDIWLNPWADASNTSFQIVQSLLAFASGGVFGQGAGQGSPTYIPVVHSDFIFAAIAEEWGLLGGLSVLALLALLAMRAMRLALITSNPFRSYFAAGMALMLGGQSLLIIGGVLKLIPLTGVTLPFLSYGGSSLLMSFVMIALLLLISADPI
jgi:cell division protein FtsW (lipid II flippase)